MTKPNITRAQFSTVPSSGPPIPVHFNPTSMQLVVSNEMEPDRPDHHQYVKKTTAKLTLDLIFDTTDKGEDVRNTTKKIERLMKPVDRVPPVALFEWGVFRFQGLVESYRETIDFFSGDGVPLRAGINLTLSQQEQVFEDTGQGGGDGSGRNGTTASGGGGGGGGGGAAGTTPSADAVDVPPGDDSATDMATEGGDPEAGRDIAAANEEENIRFPSGPMTLDPSVTLGPPVAFASGGAGLGLGAGAGIGIGGGGIGVGGGVGLGIGGGASFGASAGIGVKGGIGMKGGVGFGAKGGVGFGAKGGVGFGASAGFSARGGASFAAGAKAGAGFGISGGASAGFSASATASASAGFTTGASIGAGSFSSASASFSASAGFKASASAGALFGGSASAGVMASEGAFLGLRARVRPRRFTLDTSRFIKRSESVSVTTDSGARFRIGGQATFEESTSLSTNVGASASLRTRIRFEEG